MSSSGTQPPDEWRGGNDGQDNQGLGGPSGSSPWPSAQPTGWERPGSDPSAAPPASSQSGSTPSGSTPSGSTPSGSSPSGSAAPSQPSASEWPGYPPSSQPSAPEPTRSFSADQPPAAQPGYQPYDQQAMPGYGSGSSGGSGGYGNNPYDTNPYETSPYQPNPYQPYGAYQAYAAPASHPKATTAFVLGLLGLVLCPPVGIAGLVMGGRVRREIDASGGQWGGRGLATAGWVLGILSVVYLAVIVLYVIFVVIVIGADIGN